MLAYKELTGKSKFDFLSDLKYLHVVTMANYEERSANAMEEIVSFLSENVNCANLNIEVTCFTLKTQNVFLVTRRSRACFTEEAEKSRGKTFFKSPLL